MYYTVMCVNREHSENHHGTFKTQTKYETPI